MSTGTGIWLTSRSGGDIRLAVPQSFSADLVRFHADPGALDTTAFPALTNGKGFGTPGAGASALLLESHTFGGSTGNVTLAAY